VNGNRVLWIGLAVIRLAISEDCDILSMMCWCLQPLTPSDAKPDMAMLRLIKESELRRGTIIGSGAFGTVYRVTELDPVVLEYIISM